MTLLTNKNKVSECIYVDSDKRSIGLLTFGKVALYLWHISLAIFLILFIQANYQPVYAAEISNINLQLSKISEIDGVQHTLYALLPNGVSAGQTYVLAYPVGYVFGATFDHLDMRLAQGSSTDCDTATFTNKTLGAVASGTTWGAVLSGQTITFTSDTDTLSTNCVRVILQNNGGTDSIANPTVTSNTIYTTQLIANGTDVGNTAVVILDDNSPTTEPDEVNLTATVVTSISLDVDVATTNCQNTTETSTVANAINLGSLTPGQVNVSGGSIKYACLDLATNASSGVRLLVHSNYAATIGALDGPGSALIQSATANLNSTGVSSGYGIRIFSLGLQDTGSFSSASPFNSGTSADIGLLPGSTTTPATVLTSAGIVKTADANRIAIEVAAKSKSNDAAGTYTDTITFTAIVKL